MKTSEEMAEHLTRLGGRYTILGKKARSNPFDMDRRPPAQSLDHKPKGTWYACGGEWLDWMDAEMPNWIRAGDELYELDVRTALWGAPARSRVWTINTPEDLQEFDDVYAEREEHNKYISEAHKYIDWAKVSGAHKYIDWAKVARKCGGIEICPYQWDARLSIMWYYTWDVASGCIWDMDALRRVKLRAVSKEVDGEIVWVRP